MQTVYPVVGVVIEPTVDRVPSIAVVDQNRRLARQHVVRVEGRSFSPAFSQVSADSHARGSPPAYTVGGSGRRQRCRQAPLKPTGKQPGGASGLPMKP